MAMTVRYTVVNGEIIAEKRSGVRRFYVPNPQGETILLLGSNQHPTGTFCYWSYGEVTQFEWKMPTPFLYVGTLGYSQEDAERPYVRAR